MTSSIIYHDFRSTSELTAPAPAVALTAHTLTKGRRILKTAAKVSAALDAVCVFLCGACTAVSLFVIGYIFLTC